MRPNAKIVNRFLGLKRTFPQNITAVFRVGYKLAL
jgi:hypothetical protein